MKKKFLWMFMVAAAAMTSCSSFDEPAAMDGEGEVLSRAGERAVYVASSEQELRALIAKERENIVIGKDFTLTQTLEIPYAMTLSGSTGVTLSTEQPIVCKGSVYFKDLTIDAATPVGLTAAIRISADNIDVVLDNVQLTQNTPGQADTNEKASMAINVDNYGGSLQLINHTTLTIPSNYVRGINMYSNDNSVVNLTIKDSKIHCGGTDLTKPAVLSRGLQFGSVTATAENPVKIYNSVIEGPYYDINITGSSKVNFDIKNTTFNGRGAFNVWAPGQVISLDSCTLIGQNHYNGGYEQFADIKLNDGADNCTLNITDTKFMMNRTPYEYNQQLAILFYGTGINVNFYGNNTIYDNSNETDSFIGQTSVYGHISIYGIDNIHIMESAPGATVVTPYTNVTYSETPLK